MSEHKNALIEETTKEQHEIYYQQVGLFAVTAAQIEYIIELVLIGLLGTNQRYGGALMRCVGFEQQIKLIKKILTDKYGEDSVQYIKMSEAMKNANEAYNKRNEYVHAVMFYSDTGEINKKFRKIFFDISFEDVDLKRMNHDLIKSNTALGYLLTVIEEFGFTALPP